VFYGEVSFSVYEFLRLPDDGRTVRRNILCYIYNEFMIVIVLCYSEPIIHIDLTIIAKTSSAFVQKVCSADHKGSATSSQGIRGYISVMATLKFTYFLNQRIMI
jgi:hypothetical protein